MIRFNADYFRAALLCVSKEETRYYLKGVYATPHAKTGVVLVATDGHRLICIHDENGRADESAIIALSADALKACKQPPAEKRNGMTRVVIVDGHDATVKTVAVDNEGNATESPVAFSSSCRIDGTFPDYARIIPTPTFDANSRPGHFNGNYLSDFAKAAAILAPDNSRAMLRVLSHDPGSPAVIRFDDAPQAFGVLMPVRGGAEETMPEWFNAKPNADTKAA